MKTPNKENRLGVRGVAHLKLTVDQKDLDKVVISGMTINPDGRGSPGLLKTFNKDGTVTVEGYRGNAFVLQGLGGVLDSAYGDLTADRITHIGLSGDTTAVTINTTTLGTPNSIKTTANVSRTGATVSTDQTWTQADVAFAITKIGLLRGSAATDVSNIIGGVGGAAPYDEPFTIDLTNIATWTLTMGIDVTLTAS